MILPAANRPKITSRALDDGIVMRYFVKRISSGTIIEVDAVQYSTFASNPYYQTISLPWTITGNDINTTTRTGHIIYGAQHKNTEIVKLYNVRMSGLAQLLRNPLEYFFGRYNTPIAPSTAVATTAVYTVTAPVVVVPEPEPEPEPVWTVVALDTFTNVNGTTMQEHTPDLGFTGWAGGAFSTDGAIRIQENRARQTAAPLGGRRHIVTTSNIVSDEFKFYADLYPAGGAAETGIIFRNNGNALQSTVSGGTLEGIELATTATSGSGDGFSVRLALRPYVVGAQQADFWQSGATATVNIPNFPTVGARFEVVVFGATVSVYIRPAGGGTAIYTVENITIPSPVYNDSSHQRFGLRYGSSLILREFDNFTVETLQLP
jgi:hypothetical protein